VDNLSRFPEPVWDRFFDFVFVGDEGLTYDQVQEELRRRGIDLTQAQARVRKVLETAQARATENRGK
jgi:hypothetical protein